MSLARFYPLRAWPRQGQLWSWISFDVANQSFTLLINTLLFSIFFKEIVAAGAKNPNTRWAVLYASSMLLVVAASPIAGAIADERAWKKPALIITGFACALLTCMLALIQPGQIWLAALLYIPANFSFAIGENFLASFLPDLTERKNFGRLSGFSWGISYAAALIILILTGIAMKEFDLGPTDKWRPFFVFAGVWFIAFALPTLFFLRERPVIPAHSGVSFIKVGFLRVGESLRRIRKFRDLATLLGASVLYGTGMSVVITFASIIAAEFGFTQTALVGFVAVITVSGVVGTLFPTFLQDRIGHKRTTLLLLGLWVFTTLALASYAYMHDTASDRANFPTWPLWLLGNLLGFGLGSLGAANRAFVGFLAPRDRAAEVFGLWGMVFKLAAVMTVPFALAKDLWGTPASLLVLAAFLIAGFCATLFINETRGSLAAADQVQP